MQHCHIGQYSDLDQTDGEWGAVVRWLRSQGRDVQCHRHDAPHRAWTTLLTLTIRRIKLEDLASSRYARALTLGEELLVLVVTDDTEREHGRVAKLWRSCR
jgi:hypothetical protein